MNFLLPCLPQSMTTSGFRPCPWCNRKKQKANTKQVVDITSLTKNQIYCWYMTNDNYKCDERFSTHTIVINSSIFIQGIKPLNVADNYNFESN